MEKTKNKKCRLKLKVKKQIYLMIVAIIGSFLFIYGIINVVEWLIDSLLIKEQDNQLKENLNIERVKSSTDDEIINPPNDKNNDYWNYIKLPLLSVDFNELNKKNKDTVAFIKVQGTNINYPVVQALDNKYYLNHSYDKTKNDAGWVFLDYRNDINDLQDNTIIYAHGRYDTTMFGSLKNIFKSNWYKNTDNYVIYISTPSYNTLWQVFSVYQIPTETYYLTSSFGSLERHDEFLNKILKRSKFDFNTSINTKDKILTLSTCYNKSDKVVLHAKLIKKLSRK